MYEYIENLVFGEAESEAAIALHELNLERLLAPRREMVEWLQTESALPRGVTARFCMSIDD